MRFSRKFSLALLVLACITTSAFAQNFYWNASSPSSVALGGVYVPSSSDAQDALATNPAGLAYNLCDSRLEGAYVFDPTAREHVDQSGLLSAEYDNSTVRVGTQSLTLGYSVYF